ncbi:MarR family winged helix-turn-helix transcriptional regulator [Chelativorans sp. YIM 93263]|uniref:MarR family winged helix-turn-helix transcriptional regulator n=1 Tax=Chelativorans sp. YIM 93263 TaxID=2906648 RepID=UPI00237A0902|nr:MarR family transcriptional regulator [Chelativorans sp. YIM 93263]
MNPRIDPETFGFLVTDLARLIKADLDRRISAAGIGVTPGEARALLHAARAGEVRQNVLAERMGLEPMTLSAYLDRLEASGLVERPFDPSDRRAKLVKLTEKADGALKSITRVARDARREARGGISDEEWALLGELLKKVRGNLQRGT